jgi:FkbM family methyltransferase
MRPFDTIIHTARELRQAWAVGDDLPSRARLAADVLLFRVLRVLRLPETERRVRLGGGVKVTYRLNRGDIQSIREIWFDEAYRLPFTVAPRVLVDLGANIGMTCLWYDRHHRFARMIAVEPSSGNMQLLKKNLADNAIECELFEAAIGAEDGRADFLASKESNLGRIASDGSPDAVSVRLISMATILNNLRESGFDTIDLLKIDIEGGEAELLTRNVEWLDRVNGIVIEFHPDRVDYPGLVSQVTMRGLRYIPGGSVFECHTDSFVRDAEVTVTAGPRPPAL